MNRTSFERPWAAPMTIGRSFLLWLLGVLLVVLVLVSAMVLWHEKSLLEQELVERSEMVARTLLAAATDERSPVYPASLSLTDLRSGEVRTIRGDVLWSYGPPPEQALELDPDLLRIEVEASADRTGTSPAPARVVLLVSRTRISTAIATAAVRLVLALAAVLAIALIVGLLVVERIVRPLRRLGSFLDDLDPSVAPSRPDLGPAASEVVELGSTTFDMAARLHQQRNQLVASERRFRELFVDSPTPLLQIDQRLVVRAANPAAAGLLAVNVDRVEGKGLDALLGDVSAVQALSRVASGAAGAAAVVEAAWPLGREVDEGLDVELHVKALGDGTMLLAVHDLTERMRRMAERWKRTFDAMSDGVALLGIDDSVLAANRVMGELIPVLEGLLHDEAAARGSGSWRSTAAGRVLQCALSPIDDGGERILVVRDITEAVAAEERLREAEKLEAIGSLASGVAHDFNNLLAGIQLQARLLLRDPDAGEEAIAAILALADEGGEVVRELLVYAQREHSPRRLLDLCELVRSQESVLRHLTPSGVELHVRVASEPVLIFGRPVGLRRMVLNLFVNATAAVADGGRVAVTVSGNSTSAVLEVVDDGVGIEREVLSRVFEPFYSTRRSDRGAGLGLAVVARVASDHGGSARVESLPGAGTTVRVELPLATHEDVDGVPMPAEPPDPVGGPRVLVVMADPHRAARLMAALADRGCDPRHARDLEEAFLRIPEDLPQLVVVGEPESARARDQLARSIPVVVVGGGSSREATGDASPPLGSGDDPEAVAERVLGLFGGPGASR